MMMQYEDFKLLALQAANFHQVYQSLVPICAQSNKKSFFKKKIKITLFYESSRMESVQKLLPSLPDVPGCHVSVKMKRLRV